MKPIKLTQALIDQMKDEFAKKLATLKLSDGKVSYTRALTYDTKDADGATILFEPVAYAKMLMLLHTFTDEVAWHGTVERQGDRLFIIKDIIVYPQEVTGGTVTTDQDRYQTWLMELMMRDDDVFDTMHMQGHSHVNFSTTPSPVDTAFYDSILDQLTDEDFYIFMIFNKRLEHTVKIYDLKANMLYENDDIEIGIRCESGDLNAFMADAKEMVVRKTFATPGYAGAGSTGGKGGGKKDDAWKKSGKKGAIQQSPGYYGMNYGGDNYAGTDYDEEIFEKRPTYWWNKEASK